ncbi:MAG: hypothetical protein PHQ05_04770 [Sterolibacterium sp.]|nr:hypothetical protein [Sterolibacterium sp.]
MVQLSLASYTGSGRSIEDITSARLRTVKTRLGTIALDGTKIYANASRPSALS